MKKTLFTLALVALTASSSFAQGLIGLRNSFLTPINLQAEAGGALRKATIADGLNLSVYFGPAGTAAENLQKLSTATPIGMSTTAGVLMTGIDAFALPVEGGQTVSLQLRATANGGYEGATRVIQVVLATAPAAGTPIWHPSNTSLFTPLTLSVVPEPSTIALGVLGLGSLLLFRRRK